MFSEKSACMTSQFFHNHDFFPYNFKYIVLIFSNKEIWMQEEDERIGEIKIGAFLKILKVE